MKDPSEKHYPIDVEDFGPDQVCAETGYDWPCKAWRKWTKSKDYRIARLEERVDKLTLNTVGDRKELARLRTARRRNGLITAAHTEWLAGLNQTTGHAAGIEVRRDVETIGVSDGWAIKRVAMPETFEVRYGDGEWKS